MSSLEHSAAVLGAFSWPACTREGSAREPRVWRGVQSKHGALAPRPAEPALRRAPAGARGFAPATAGPAGN
eukprot:11182691-Lingulodinium_polyedra.AAC.1